MTHTPTPRPNVRPCFKTTIGGMPIVLSQQGPNDFTVQYFKQIKERLSYTNAARELGACIMHALACESRLDNNF